MDGHKFSDWLSYCLRAKNGHSMYKSHWSQFITISGPAAILGCKSMVLWWSILSESGHVCQLYLSPWISFSEHCQTSRPRDIGMVTLFFNCGTTLHNQKVLKYIPFQWLPVSGSPLRIKFETEKWGVIYKIPCLSSTKKKILVEHDPSKKHQAEQGNLKLAFKNQCKTGESHYCLGAGWNNYNWEQYIPALD